MKRSFIFRYFRTKSINLGHCLNDIDCINIEMHAFMRDPLRIIIMSLSNNLSNMHVTALFSL